LARLTAEVAAVAGLSGFAGTVAADRPGTAIAIAIAIAIASRVVVPTARIAIAVTITVPP